jgi:hypothetical protein
MDGDGPEEAMGLCINELYMNFFGEIKKNDSMSQLACRPASGKYKYTKGKKTFVLATSSE